MKPLILLLIVLLSIWGNLSADINQYYTFMSGTAPYVPINGTVVNIPAAGISGSVDIGFPFHYGENVYTQVNISCCGYITFRMTTVNSTVNNLGAYYTAPLIAALWDYNFPTSTVMTLLTGAAPNRVFTVQYTNVTWPPSSQSSCDFQIKLFEDGQINLCYGPANYVSGYGGASIGINMVPGGQGWFLSVNMVSPITVSSTISYNNINTYPGESTIFIFVSEPLPVHDLRVVSLDSAPSLNQNEVGNFTVSVHNHGFVTESNYTVNLMKGSNILATTTGPTIAANETIPLTLSWTPSDSGIHILYGEVVSQTDVITNNNTSDSISVAVFPHSTTPITLSNGTNMNAHPTVIFEPTSLSEVLYHGSLVNYFGSIKAVTYYNHFNRNVLNMPTQIWMGTTSFDVLPVTWLPSTQLTLVFDGFVNLLAGDNVICIPLNTPFSYSEQNLVVMFFKQCSYASYPATNLFYGALPGDPFSSLFVTSDNNDINPASPPVVSSAYQSMPKTTFHFANGVNIQSETTDIYSKLLNNYPNPFNPETTITYDIKESQPVNISIYNLKGQLVKTLVNEIKTSGQHTLTWNGKDNYGKKACPGVYLYKMQGKSTNITKKMLLIE